VSPLLDDAEVPERVRRALTKEARRQQRRIENAKKTAAKVRNEHGGKDWRLKNGLCRQRDGNRCVFRCQSQRLGVQVHHWRRTVGAGGKNDLIGLVCLCAWCHDGAHTGRISRGQIRDALLALHPHLAAELGEGA